MSLSPSALARPALLAASAAALLAASACGSDEPAPAPAASSPPSASSGPSAGASATSSPPPAAEGTGAPGLHRDDEADLQGEDQQGDGTSVRVEDVQLSTADGFVAVFAADGSLLGSAPVARSDEDVDVDVPLSPAQSGTVELRAVLYADDGDGALDPAVDPQVAEDDEDDEDDGDAGDGDDVVADRFTLTVG